MLFSDERMENVNIESN